MDVAPLFGDSIGSDLIGLVVDEDEDEPLLTPRPCRRTPAATGRPREAVRRTTHPGASAASKSRPAEDGSP